MPGVTDMVWSAQATSPGAIDEALRHMLAQLHAENASYVPARALNLVCIVEKEWSGEIANRLRQVGRFHASRTVVLAVERGRRRIDAVATVSADVHPRPGEFAALRETVILDIGERHLPHLDTIVDPLVITDLPTLLWAPHGHEEALTSVLPLVQAVLRDSIDDPELRAALETARRLLEEVYVVDLAWLRSTPWRERVAATFDPPHLRPDLRMISAVTVRHHPESTAAAVLLVGWLASRLEWQTSPLLVRDGGYTGSAHTRRQDVRITLEPDRALQVRGLAGVTLETASGRWLSLDRGPGGLQACYRNAKGDVRRWTVLGASRGEPGILGEGIRQALLRDPTYGPALTAASSLVP